MPALTVIVPACNEAPLIGRCLGALVASDVMPDPVELIVVANGCRDSTAALAKAAGAAVERRGWALTVLDLPQFGKCAALNAGDRVATHGARLYLDADVTVTPALLPQIARALDPREPVYASGTIRITAGDSLASRAYARIWRKVPFMRAGVPGCGLFAVNAAGRARWDEFPDVIADDTFVRLHFTPKARAAVPASFDWPVAEGFGPLVRVRRRQDAGTAEIADRYPELMVNEDKGRLGLSGLLRLAASDPFGSAVYGAVALSVRLAKADGWSRGR